MVFDFDEIIDRRNTYSIKYDMAGRGKPLDLLPLWVADMDFRAPPCVTDALAVQSRHGIFGYSEPDKEYFDVLRAWFSARHSWETEPDWLVRTPGVVTAIHIAVRALTNPGDAVIIQQPVYYPFASAVGLTGRLLVVNELEYLDGRYSIDFDDFEEKIKRHNVKMFILCSPHNPVGRVWTQDELVSLGEICLKHGVIVVSDEIHQDFVFEGHAHRVFAAVNPDLRDMTVTCTAPSKTFNLAGLQISNIFIADKKLRSGFMREYARSGLSQTGVMGLVACRAAYAGGGEWLEQLRGYLAGNISFIQEFLRERLPSVRQVETEGTYLVWLDFRQTGLNDDELDDLALNKAGLWLDNGTMFGPGGTGFMRLNAACPRATLHEAFGRLEAAMRGLT